MSAPDKQMIERVDNECASNTDRELWREADDYYAASVHITTQGSFGINVGGRVIVMPLREWHALALSAITPPNGERQLGYYDALDKVMNFINQLDSGDMDGRQVRSAIYGFCLEARPTPPNGDEVREALEGNVVELKTARGYIAVEDCDLELWNRLQEAQAVNGPVISIIAEFRETITALAKEKRG